jgi:PrtD family type I secretion system ABC transporter
MKDVINKCKGLFVQAAFLSFAIETLMLIPPLYMLQIFDRVIHSRSIETLVMLSLIAVFGLVIAAILETLRSMLLTRASVRFQSSIAPEVLQCMLVSDKNEDSKKHGLEDVNIVQSFLSGNGIKAFFEIPWIPLYLFLLYLFHPYFVILAVIGTLLLFSITYIEEKLTICNQQEAGASLRQASDIIAKSLRNSEVIRALSMQDNVINKWWIKNKKYLRKSITSSTVVSSLHSISRFVRNTIQLCSLGGAAFLIIHEGLTPGIMIASTIIIGRAMGPMDKLISTWKSFINVRGAYNRLKLMLSNRLTDTPHLSLPAPDGHISIEHLHFYISAGRDILRGINIELHAGESLAVIGPSASGKTSLARLLVGLYKPCDGFVRLDGADVYYLSQQGLGKYIGYLPQNVELFSGTIAENIARLSDISKHANDIVSAARLARAHDFILRLPKGYDTEIGEEGGILSGGQRQLIGLARALFRKPKVIVLDEPNSNLDGASEMALVEVFSDLKASGTSLVVITHKPSLLRQIDKLLVLSKGRQEAFGPRAEIMPNYLGVAQSKSHHISSTAVSH